MKFCLTAIGALLVTFVPAFAANVRFLAWDDAIAARKAAVVAGERTLPINNLHPLQRTPIVAAPVTEAGDIVVRALDRNKEDGTPADFTVRVGAGIQNPLILLMPDEKAPSGLRGQAFDDSSANFPWGSYRFINVTGAPLIMGLGNKRYPLASGWKAVDVRDPGEKALPVWFVLASQPEKPLYTNLWSPDAETRRLVILLPSDDPRLGPLAVKVIPENQIGANAEVAPVGDAPAPLPPQE